MKIISINKKAKYDYFLLDSFEAGIVLTGTEIKSIRANGINLKDSYVRITKDLQVYLINMHISHYDHGNQFNHDETRERKLLLNKREIRKLFQESKEKNLTIVPTKIYFTRGMVKVEIALAQGKKNYDKREVEKERDANREIQKHLKNY
ncbi:SsrA-binding protein [Bacilli bacterium PM5-3]|nr:SsrA-binding protein [Bacilli bacterium PM5-3]MDH6604322.1 SsrA-binding protein [Bacilli bacterium PM5-9]